MPTRLIHGFVFTCGGLGTPCEMQCIIKEFLCKTGKHFLRWDRILEDLLEALRAKIGMVNGVQILLG